MKLKKNMVWCYKNISTEGHFKLSVDMLKKSTHFFISNVVNNALGLNLGKNLSNFFSNREAFL